jgi:hypothetical protein
MTTGGDITVLDGALLATTGTPGYAAYVESGAFRHDIWRAVGTVSGYPYYMVE